MNLFFTISILALAAFGVFFFAKFTHYGAIDFKTAWKSLVLWGSGLLAAFGPFVADLLAWFAQLWDPLQAQAGDLLANPSFGKALQLVGLFFFLLRSKGQGFPTFKFPDLPKAPEPPQS